MKYNKDDLKEKAIELYLNGKTYNEIGKKLGYSREYIGNMIRNDKRVLESKNNVKLKIERIDNGGRVYLNKNLLSKLGINLSNENDKYVNIIYDKNQKQIVIKNTEN